MLHYFAALSYLTHRPTLIRSLFRNAPKRLALVAMLVLPLLLVCAEVPLAASAKNSPTPTPRSSQPTHKTSQQPRNTAWQYQDTLIPDYADGYFGANVSLTADGNLAAVGAIGLQSGAGYIFQRSSGTWNELYRLTDPRTDLNRDASGPQISQDGNTLLMAWYGTGTSSAYVYTRSGNKWILQTPTGLPNPDAADSFQFGNYVALSGDGNTAMVEGGYNAGSGDFTRAVYTYTRHNGNWTYLGRVSAADASTNNDDFGINLALSYDGLTGVISNSTDSNGQGGIYILKRTAGSFWATPINEITANDVEIGDNFGYGVAISADASTIAVGSPDKTVNSYSGAGVVYILKSDGNGGWSQQAELQASDAGWYQKFGIALALSNNGGVLMSGSTGQIVQDANGKTQVNGSAYLFTRNSNGNYSEQDEIAQPAALVQNGAFFGGAVALNQDGSVALAGAESQSAAYVFVNSGGGTNPTPTTPAGTTTPPTTTTPPVGTTTPPSGGNSYTYYLPFLANSASGFTSYLAFQNGGNVKANFSLQFYNSSGNSIQSPTLSGDCASLVAQAECLPTNPFASGQSGTGLIVSDQPLNVIVAEATAYGGSAYAVSQGSSNNLIVPISLHNAYGDFNTQLTIFNGGNSAANVQVQFYDQNGTAQTGATKTLNLGSHISQLLNQSASDSGLPNNFNGWAQITSPSGTQLVAQTLEQSPSQHFVAIANAVATSTAASTLYAPAIFNGAFKFTTGANLVNPNSNAIQVSITYYDDSGSATTTSTFTLNPFSTASIFQGGSGGNGLPSGGLAQGFSGAAIVQATGGNLVMVVNESAGIVGGISLSGVYGAAHSGGGNVGLPVMAKNGFGYTTGATIFNTSNAAVSGNIQYYNTDGSPQGSPQPFSIDPHASQLVYQGAETALPDNFYGSAVVSETGGGNDLIVTTNAQSNLFYTYTEPN